MILEKIKQNKNEWYLHSLGIMLLVVTVVLNGYVEISFALYGLSIVLMGIGALWNESKKQSERLEKICANQKIIIHELLCKNNEDRKYEYTKDGATVMLNKAELLNIFMNEEKQNQKKEWIWNGKITTIKRKAEMLKNILKLIDEGEI